MKSNKKLMFSNPIIYKFVIHTFFCLLQFSHKMYASLNVTSESVSVKGYKIETCFKCNQNVWGVVRINSDKAISYMGFMEY